MKKELETPETETMECGPDLILIKPEEVKREGPIIMSEEEKKNASKEQNRGTIVYIGENVDFWKVGDYISFYKGATTTVKDKANREDYLTINKGHVLVRYKTKTITV